MAKAKILVVEDEAVVAEDIKVTLQNMGYEVSAVIPSGETAVKKTEELKPDLVLMDIVLKGKLNGIDAAREIHSRLNIPVIYLTAYSDEKTLERAKVTEPFGYIVKPFGDRELHSAIEVALYKHRMERKLKESQEWLSTVLGSIGDAIIATDREAKVIFMNLVAEALTGCRGIEVMGKGLKEVFNIINEETGKEIENPVTKILGEGVAVKITEQAVLVSKDGIKRLIDGNSSPIKNEEGKIIGAVLVFRDVTEKKHTQTLIERAAEEWRKTFDAIPDFVSVVDKDFKFARVNKSLADFMKVKPEEMIGQDFHEVFCAPGTSSDPLCRGNKIEKLLIEEVHYPKINAPMMVSISPILNEKGEIWGFVHIAKDITEIKKAHEKLQKSEEELRTKVEELEKFYEMAVGRELKMMELKKEIKRLQEKLSDAKSNSNE